MNYKAHLIFGVILSIIFIVLLRWQFGWYDFEITNYIYIAQLCLILGISPLVPDLDHEIGKLHQTFIAIGLLTAMIGLGGFFIFDKGYTLIGEFWKPLLMWGIIIAAATFFFAQIAHHRGRVHSIPLCLLYGTVIGVVFGLNLQLGILAAFGCYTHLIADGIPFKMWKH